MINGLVVLFAMLYWCSFMMVIQNDDWFLIWLGMELNMFSFLFIFYVRDSINNMESCMKYFFVQSLGSALFVSFFYMSWQSNFKLLGSLILSYKLGAGPFFFWFPSVVVGFEWVGSFFLMSFQKIIPLMLVMVFIGWVMWFVLIVSLMVGVVGSFNQNEIKSLFAYSSIHHLGWLFLCEMVDVGVWFVYFMIYMLMIFIIVFMLWYCEFNTFLDVTSWERKWWFVMNMIGMAGMPPFLGFFLSWMAFYFISSLNWFMLVFMLIMSVIMFYIYIRIVYEIMLGSVENISWFYNLYKSLSSFNMDLFMMLGFLMGMIIGLVLIL